MAPPLDDAAAQSAEASSAAGAAGLEGVAAAAPLPMHIKLSFGAPSFAGAAMAIPIVIHLSIFYSDVILVPLGLIALVKAVARAFDALTDPLMGWATDRTRTRFGRRRPWIALGAPLAACAFYAMFSPPESLTPQMAAVWFAGSYTLYYLFHTVYEIPHAGLGPELTLDYHERTALFGWRVPFIVLGTMVASLLPPVLISLTGSQRAGYSLFAMLFGSVLVVLYANLILQVRERPDFVQREPNPLVPGVRRVMRNRAFRVLLLVYVTGSITGAIPGLMMPYFTKYVLRPDDPDQWLALFLALYFGSGFLFLPLWLLLARRFGKLQAWLTSFVPGLTGSLALFFLIGEGDLVATAIVLMWSGSAFSAGLFLGPAMQADVIDYDELYTGRRREAQFAGLWSVMTKFTVIPSMAIPLAILASYGYVPNVEQTPTVQFVIRAIFGLAPAITSFAAFLIAIRYPISQRVHQQIWQGIEAHRRGESAVDPLTGQTLPPPIDRGIEESTGWFLDHFSPRELRSHLDAGVSSLLQTTISWAAGAAVVTAVAGWIVLSAVSDLTQEPGVVAVLGVVVAGFGFTLLCFSLVRVRAAFALRRQPVAAEKIENHLEFTHYLATGIDLPPGLTEPSSEPAGAG